MQKSKRSLISRIFTEKCPHCGEGDVYEKPSRLFHMPVMHERCPQCHYLYEREPGYFLGAMYISYGLAVFQGLLAFAICYFFLPQLSTLTVCFIILAVTLLFSVRNFRWSRVIYMYIFPN